MRWTALALVLVACGVAGPVPLEWGTAPCTHCHMTLSDRRYGAEVVTRQGRALPFDDAGCAATALTNGEVDSAAVASLWVIDFTHPDSLIDPATATFVRSAAFRTPMGSGIVAFSVRREAQALAESHHGELLGWTDVVRLARADSLAPR